MTDMRIGSEQLSREYALRILTATPDDPGNHKPRSSGKNHGLANDAVLEAAHAQVIKILINALGDADVAVSAGQAQAGASTGAGNDTISATAGSADLISSGDGNDTISIKTSGGYAFIGPYLVSSVDRVEAGAGDDTISISSHGSVARTGGGAGDDDIRISSTVISSAGAGVHGIDTTDGGAGNDVISLTSSSDVLRVFGDEGDDSVVIEALGSVLGVYGDEGDDTIDVVADSASGLYGGSGDDQMTVKAERAANIYGGDGDDLMVVDVGQSAYGLYGGDGNDVIQVKASTLYNVEGGAGDDHLILESLWGDKNTVYFSEGDGHDVVETNKPLEIKRFNSDGTAVAESEATVRRNGDGTVTIEFPGGRDSVTVKFIAGSTTGDVVVEQFKGSLIVSRR